VNQPKLQTRFQSNSALLTPAEVTNNLFQEFDVYGIEIVGRLIEHHELGLLRTQQASRKCDPAPVMRATTPALADAMNNAALVTETGCPASGLCVPAGGGWSLEPEPLPFTGTTRPTQRNVL
jgi:hypothetical protein